MTGPRRHDRPRALTRRQALAELALGSAALMLAGCGSTSTPMRAAVDGSTLRSTYVDPRGDGVLQIGPGSPLIDRTELAPRAAPAGVLCTIAHLTDAHVLDEQSPARVTFLDRLGPPFTSTFRPQEALTRQVLAGAMRAINALAPDAVIQGGDLIDNAQDNELTQALTMLRGGRVGPAGPTGAYVGVQSAQDPDPFYYRPDIDAPRHPGMLNAAVRAFAGEGLRAHWYPVMGDHDILVQGVLAPTPATRAIALGSRAVWELPSGLRIPQNFSASSLPAFEASSPDGLADPQVIDSLIEQLRSAPAVSVPADPSRRELSGTEVLTRLRAGGGRDGIAALMRDEAAGGLMDYSFDVGPNVRVIVLDLVRREGGSGGLAHPGQPTWLADELARGGDRWVLVVSHQPLTSTAGGDALLAALDEHPRVLAALWGHTHRNSIIARQTAGGGYWLIATCSLIDYPQQARALRIRATAGGGVVLETWMLDHVPDGGLGDISRELAYLDAQGGRPQGFAGDPLDRNVRLYKRGPPEAV